MTSALSRNSVHFLSLLSEANRRRLLEGSTRAVYPGGTVAFRPGDPPRAVLVDRGLVRIYWSVDDRQATLAFIHKNELAGATAIMGQAAAAFAQVVVDSRLTDLDLQTARKLVAMDIEVSNAVATHLASQVRHAIRLIAIRSLGNIRERLAYDLLDRACQSQLVVGRLEARVTQSDLAASIGSSREVVSRAMKSLRAAGLVKTRPGVVRVADPLRLAATIRAFGFEPWSE